MGARPSLETRPRRSGNEHETAPPHRVPRRRATRAAVGKLTKAEIRVLNLLSCANTNKEIAAIVGVSPATVKRHVENILSKLRLRNRVEAAIYGLLVSGCAVEARGHCSLAAWRRHLWKGREL